ncbi:ABC transporter permease, partial [Burkholderia dolosa]|nr:ABC transporter permease [Burkholderia dolosa]
AVRGWGEAGVSAGAGGAVGMRATPPAASLFKQAAGGIFPVFRVSTETVALQAACTIAVGIAAAIVPAWQAARVRVVEGLRAIG